MSNRPPKRAAPNYSCNKVAFGDKETSNAGRLRELKAESGHLPSKGSAGIAIAPPTAMGERAVSDFGVRRAQAD